MAAVEIPVHGQPMKQPDSQGFALCLDLGSQRIKARLLDVNGEGPPVQSVSVPAKPEDQSGRVELDSIWQSLDELLLKMAEHHPVECRQTRALAATSQRATQVFLDAAGQPVAPAISWQNQQLASPPPIPAPWRWMITASRHASSINTMRRSAPVWLLRETHPTAWQGCRYTGLLGAWLNQQLSGHFADCAQAQVGYLPFIHQRARWARAGHWMRAALALTPRMLPALVPAGQPMAHLKPELARRWGLADKLALIACAGDKAVEALGTGCLHSATATASLATQITVLQPLSRYRPPFPPWPLFAGARPGSFLAEQAIELRGQRFHDLARAWAGDQPRPEQVIEQALLDPAQSTPKAPLLQDYRALVEQLAEQLREAIDSLSQATNSPIDVLRLTGGLSRSRLIRQAICGEVPQLRVEQASPVAGLQGVAMTAWHGLLGDSWPSLVARMIRPVDPPV